MFNLNGHPYFGIDEKIELWKWYQGQIEIPEIGDIRIMRTTISGDMGWIASRGSSLSGHWRGRHGIRHVAD